MCHLMGQIQYQWAICCSDGEIPAQMMGGTTDREEDKNDLIRYLPTVKSWNDPIPPHQR
jgi:hypothetical protein